MKTATVPLSVWLSAVKACEYIATYDRREEEDFIRKCVENNSLESNHVFIHAMRVIDCHTMDHEVNI